MIDEILKALNETQPTYKSKLPVSKKDFTYNPYKMKDQKTIALIADQSHVGMILKNICNIVKNCSSIDKPENLYLADLEFAFLQIRSKSVEENINLQLDLDPPLQFNVNVNDIVCTEGELSKQICVNNDVQIELKQPIVFDYFDIETLDDSQLMKKIIYSLTVNKIRYDLKILKSDEVEKIINEITIKDSTQFFNFIKNYPKLTYTVETETGPIVIEGFLRFFI